MSERNPMYRRVYSRFFGGTPAPQPQPQKFTKGAEDYACGALTLVRSRVAEHWAKNGTPPLQLLVHLPLARQLFTGFPPEAIRGGAFATFEGCPIVICTCGDDLGEDQLIGIDGKAEPL